jgi:hypothetical protein
MWGNVRLRDTSVRETPATMSLWTGPAAVNGKGGTPSKKATFYIPADAIAMTPNAMHDSLEKSSYVILIDRRFV